MNQLIVTSPIQFLYRRCKASSESSCEKSFLDIFLSDEILSKVLVFSTANCCVSEAHKTWVIMPQVLQLTNSTSLLAN